MTRRRALFLELGGRKMMPIAAVLFAIVAVACLLAPVVAPYPFDQIDLDALRQPPSFAHPMGTDDLGRDVLTRLLYGGRVSFLIGVLAAAVSAGIGTAVGAIAGYAGGAIDNLLMRFTDVGYAIPSLPLLIVLSSYARSAVTSLIVIIGLLSWMTTARVVRAEVLSIREREYIEAARSLGASPLAILARHVLPNALGPIVVGATLGVGNAIMIESALSFLGLGVQPPVPTWGNMLQDAQATMATKPWLTLFPGLSILAVVLAVNFIGEGLEDKLHPKLERKKR